MDLHFAYTGGDFSYLYYLAVVSALRTQKVDRAHIWSTEEPKGRYFDLVRNKVCIEVFHAEATCPSALQGKSQYFKNAHIKDCIEWAVLYNFGGVFLDLDVFCLRDITYLLGDKEVVATPYIAPGLTLFPFNNAVIVARPKSEVVRDALEKCQACLAVGDIAWGATGPTAWSCAVTSHYDLVAFPKYGVFGDIITDFLGIMELEAFKENGVLPDSTHVVHLYTSGNRGAYDKFNPEFIACSKTLIARLVRETLSRDQWDV